MAEMAFGAGKVREAEIISNIGGHINDLRLRFHGDKVKVGGLEWFTNTLSFQIILDPSTSEYMIVIQVRKAVRGESRIRYEDVPILVHREPVSKFPSEYLIARMMLVC